MPGNGKPPKPTSSTSRYWDDVMSIPGPPCSIPQPPVTQPPPPMPNSSYPSSTSASSSSRSRSSSSSRQFKCPQCPSLFERRGHLDAHVETVHEGKRPHKCPHGCGKFFGHRSSLSRHVKSAHKAADASSSSSSKKYGHL